MASRISRRLYHTSKGRLYSAKAAVQETEQANVFLKPKPAEVTKLKNGLVVATVENYSPVSRVAVVVNAGPRCESREDSGVAHCLRVAGNLTNKHSSGFKITRSMQQAGADLSIATTREQIIYGTSCLRSNVEGCLSTIRDIVTGPNFQPHQIPSLKSKMALDLALLDEQPNVKVIELLHQAAFRDTLGRSMYAPSYQLGNISGEQLEAYMSKFYTAGNMTLVGVGVDHDSLVEQASKFSPFDGPGQKPEAATYSGGEARQATKSGLTYAAIATEGPSMSSKDVLTAGILQMIMGAGPLVKYSEIGAGSRLSQAVMKAVSGPFAIGGVSVNYSDSGLFGFVAAGHAGEMDKILKAAFAEFANVTKTGVSDAEVARGKNLLKASISMQMENGDMVLQNLADQASTSSDIKSLDSVLQMVDKITTADVVNVGKRLINGKPSMAAVGDLRSTPYLDQLYK